MYGLIRANKRKKKLETDVNQEAELYKINESFKFYDA